MYERLKHMDRSGIDAQFEAMQADENYWATQLAIAGEFASFERETWQVDEADTQTLRISLGFQGHRFRAV